MAGILIVGGDMPVHRLAGITLTPEDLAELDASQSRSAG
jgi:hypothetical protein